MALLANGVACAPTSGSGVVTSKTLKSITVNGDTGANTLIVDIRNGIFAKGAMTVDLGATGASEIAVLGQDKADKMICKNAKADGSGSDGIDLDGDKTADVNVAYYTTNHFTIDLGAGDDTFDQTNCKTKMSVYGSAGKDTITVGTVITTKGDIFSGGTDGTDAAESADTITFAARAAGVTVKLDALANDGDTTTSENDTVMNDFEIVTGSAYNDIMQGGKGIVGSVATPRNASYIFNGGAGDDTMSSWATWPVAFNGGDGTDTVDYSDAVSRASAGSITVTMDGAKADDGETGDTDNVGADVENLIGTANDDVITGNAKPNKITPGDGDDTVNGGDGDDTMVAGTTHDGNDTFNGGLGSDTVDYSARTDAIGVCVVLDGSKPSGTCNIAVDSTDVTITAHALVWATAEPIADVAVEQDVIGAKGDVENVTGTTAADYLLGTSAANTIIGGGDSAATALAGGDVIVGGAGNDSLDANAYAWSLGVATPTCGALSVVVCGGDPMDLASCKSGGVFDGCWKTQ
jgi:Ca2+-binding RTX toxin-like protein